jgi:hypothetical protein
LKRLIHFFSLAVMTQVTLMLSQLILLPIQIRIWGQAETAFWNAALALATITSVVDCGLRTAGHAELIKANSDPATFPAERLAFKQIWSWIRLLILLVTTLLIGTDFIRGRIWNPNADSSWHWMLILSYALEAVLVIRITYLDSLGFYRGAEASYFGFAVLRLSVSIPAILLFHFKAAGLAVVFLSTSLVALLAQGIWLRRKVPLLHLNHRFVALSWRSLALARFTVAEPIANWTRLSFPVLIISQIASPMAVNTYVGLRAVFGAGRTTIQQLARVASVEVLKLRIQGHVQRADTLLTLFMTTAICLGSCLSFFIIIDNLRILGLYMKHFDRTLFQQVALAFSLTAPFFSYQISMNLMFRMGELAKVAHRHYGFIACALSFAVVSLFVKSLPVYLALLVLAELLLSFSFLGSRAAVRLAALTSLAIAGLWLFVHNDVGGWFNGVNMQQITMSSALFLVSTTTLASLLYLSRRSDLRSLKKPETVSPSAVLTQ